jgi:lipopolysaccharide/colanic/teichoic acid biosynthesis glycosyltransferase
MKHIPISDFVNAIRHSDDGDTYGGISSREEFSRVLDRERERADRTGQGFSLVVFECGTHDSHTDVMRILVDRILSRGVRAIDVVGWFKEGSIATLLACTSPEGAWKFAKNILNGIPAGTEEPICRVFTYPSPWISKENGEGEGRKEGTEDTLRSNDMRASSQPVSDQDHFECEQVEKIMGRPIPLWKRFLDIMGALVGFILFSPLILLIALFIKIVSPGPVFYRQERVGYLGNRFQFWKFRTMHVNNDATGHKQYLSHLINGNAPMTKLDNGRDPRIIPFGTLLRSTCLDEIPQLFNVLVGDMSLVGPRPCLPYEAEEYLQWHARRFDIVPGMTGLWQVSGKNRLSFKEMIRLDIRYSREMSPWLDTKILFLTGPAILGMISRPVISKPAVRLGEIGLGSGVFSQVRHR